LEKLVDNLAKENSTSHDDTQKTGAMNGTSSSDSSNNNSSNASSSSNDNNNSNDSNNSITWEGKDNTPADSVATSVAREDAKRIDQASSDDKTSSASASASASASQMNNSDIRGNNVIKLYRKPRNVCNQ
jgi:hypothetical protein